MAYRGSWDGAGSDNATGDEFRKIRKVAGLSISELGGLLRIMSEHDIRRMEGGTKMISGPVTVSMEMIARGDRREPRREDS